MASIPDIQSQYKVHLLTSELPDSLEVEEALGLVHGEAIMGANFVKDFFARVADVTGGRVDGYEKALKGAVLTAIEQMAFQAAERGANTVVAVRVTTCAVGGKMLMATCVGTALVAKTRESKPVAKAPQYLHPQPLG